MPVDTAMTPRHALVALLAWALLGALAPPASAQLPALGEDPVIAAVGDVACDPESDFFNGGLGDATHCRQKYTAERVMAEDPDAVVVLGDVQYEESQMWKYKRSYDPTWGQMKAITRPVIGNHEYFHADGQEYFDYFNGVGAFTGPAGDRDKSYYSFDLGAWHVVALNSVCSRVGGCGPGSPQEQWLRQDLATHPNACTMAVWHHPVHTSSGKAWPSMEPMWQVLYDAGVDVILTGHAHNYERFAPMDASGAADPVSGIRQFVVGTGGKNLTPRRLDLRATEVFDAQSFGALMLTLRPDGYEWRFARESGGNLDDRGAAECHAPPPGRPPAAVTGSAADVGQTAARLNAAIDPHNQPTTYRFEYGPTRDYGLLTGDLPLPATTGGRQPISTRITGLQPGRTYHYRVVATNPLGTVTGQDRSFRAGAVSRYAQEVGGTDGLVAHWRLGESSGEVAFDDQARWLGFYNGGYALGRRGAVDRDPDTGTSFNGLDASLRLTGPVVSDAATIEGWFRWGSGPVVMRDDSSTGGWIVLRDSGGRISYRIAGRGYRTRRATSTVRDNAWHHVALTKTGGLAQLWIDGRRIHVAQDAPSHPATMPWYVMRNGPFEEHATGRVDDVAIYERALTAPEVIAHYRAGAATTAPETFLTAPRGATNNRRPLLRFRADERRARMRCALTGPGFAQDPAPCRGPRRLGPLVDGSYRFRVYAVDRAGYPDPTPASATFRVDTRAPDATLEYPESPLRRFLRFGYVPRVVCSERCSVRARLTVDRRTARRLRIARRGEGELGRAIATASAGQVARPRILVARTLRRRLARRRVLDVTLRITVADAAGNRRSLRQPLRLRR